MKLDLPIQHAKHPRDSHYGAISVFQVMHGLFVGRFPSPERLVALRESGITDILNVSDTPNIISIDDGPFRSVVWIQIIDRVRIPTDLAVKAVDTIHQMVSRDGGRVYVHCMAGWNRSPTVLWLYLIACGIEPDKASRFICANAIDAVPGHPRLVDSILIQTIQKHGQENYLPHPRPESITTQ